MGSTGEPDRKRGNVSSISVSPSAAAVAMAKMPPFSPLSEDKKLDTAVLMFQNQKLSQKLEAQKLEISTLGNKLSQRKEKQYSFDQVLTSVDNCWEKLTDDLEGQSACIIDLVSRGEKSGHLGNNNDGTSRSSDDIFLLRIMETNTAEVCLATSSFDQTIVDDKACDSSKNILRNIGPAVCDLSCIKDGLYAAMLTALPEGDCRQKASNDLAIEVKNMRSTVSNLLLNHRSLAMELRKHQDSDLKSKAELKYLLGDLESTIQELEDCNQKFVALKSEKDTTSGEFLPVLHTGNKPLCDDRAADNRKDVQEMESRLKDSMAHSSTRLQELKCIHEERAEILRKLSTLQGSLKNVKSISSSRAFKLVKEELEKSKADVICCQAVYEKLQVEKDKVMWKERDVVLRNDFGDMFERAFTTAGSRIDELKVDIQSHKDQRKRIEATLKEACKEPGRKELISNFREFVSSFPDNMSSMQSKLRKYKGAASDVHSLRAKVQSLSNILARKTKELVTLRNKSADQDAEMRSLQAMVEDLKQTDMDLKLFVEMYRCESVLPRNVQEARDKEYEAWARVHNLKLSLDENNLELRVKKAIEAEALSQRYLAAAEAEIADLRERYESSKRSKSKLSTDLESKQAENVAYLSEIETIAQAYDDMQNQNQHLMKQIIERDDYNIKLVLEGLRGKQTRDLLLMEKQVLQRTIQQANVSRDLFKVKVARIEDQVKSCADHIHRLAEDRCQNKIDLENIERRMFAARTGSQPARESLDELQSKVKNGRVNLSVLQIELEKERFEKKRQEEELETVKRKAERLKMQREGSFVGKLHLELQEYKEILKCSICLDRPKEVVITKCYHLLCDPCVQKVLVSRHRKCPVCAASFGPNDVKPVYI
ncbi:hypothetical protein vseg_004374 [Gypsophila vaccaria]